MCDNLETGGVSAKKKKRRKILKLQKAWSMLELQTRGEKKITRKTRHLQKTHMGTTLCVPDMKTLNLLEESENSQSRGGDGRKD